MAGPSIEQGTIQNACSLVDILPTFLDIAGADDSILGEPIDGHSLLPLARGEPDPKDEAIGEYCAEMTPYPVFMIRRGALKYIHCDPDPPQLYDIVSDPLEKVNLANDTTYAKQAQAFKKEVADRWDSEDLRNRIIITQKSRRALHSAMEAGAGEPWDYNPSRDASKEYVRNDMDWPIVAAKTRFPPFNN